MQSRSHIYIVVTAFNEALYLARFLSKLQTQTSNIIVVNDGSTDGTFAIARQYSRHVLDHLVNLGKGAAMKTGADYAFEQLGAQAVIFMDGDDQHDVHDLPAFVTLLQQRRPAQLILGVRGLNHEMQLHRVLGNRFASWLVKLFFGVHVPDIPSGFKAMSRAVYRRLRWQSSDYGVELEIACKIAKFNMEFQLLPIRTIYHDLHRGMDVFDGIKMLYKILLWRINL